MGNRERDTTREELDRRQRARDRGEDPNDPTTGEVTMSVDEPEAEPQEAVGEPVESAIVRGGMEAALAEGGIEAVREFEEGYKRTAPRNIGRQAHEPHGSTRAAPTNENVGAATKPSERTPSQSAPAPEPSASAERQRANAGGPRSRGPDAGDRDTAMARANAEIDARVRARAPVKPWNPVIIAKRAKTMSKQARQLAAAGVIGAVLVGLGVCGANALTARPEAAGPASEISAASPGSDARPAQTSRPGPVTIPELLVTPTLILNSGGCPGRVPLAPQTIQNPPPGQSGRYVWAPYMIPIGCGGSVSVELDYPGVSRKEAAAWLMFEPKTFARRAAAAQSSTGATIPPERIVPGSGSNCTRVTSPDGKSEHFECTYTLVLVVTNESQ